MPEINIVPNTAIPEPIPPNKDIGVLNTIHEAMRITSTGKVGIGTTSPDQDVFGDAEKVLHMKSSNVATLRLESTHSGGSDFEISAGNSLRNVYMWNKSNGGISFGANNSEAMYITNAGRVGIGRTIANPPSEKLQVDGGSLRVDIGTTPDSAAIFAGGGSNLHIDLDSGYSTFRNTAGDTSGSGFRFKSISNDLVTIQNDGNVHIGTSSTSVDLKVNDHKVYHEGNFVPDSSIVFSSSILDPNTTPEEKWVSFTIPYLAGSGHSYYYYFDSF